jgi:hypothetical protein
VSGGPGASDALRWRPFSFFDMMKSTVIRKEDSLDDNKVKGEIQFSNALGGGWFDFTAKRIDVK